MSREEIAFRIRTLIRDLNTIQNSLVSVLCDILYEDTPTIALATLRESREFMKRTLDYIDKIIELVEAERSPKSTSLSN